MTVTQVADQPAAQEPVRYWPSEDTVERRTVLRGLMAQRHDPASVRAQVLGDEPYDQALWSRLTSDLGAAAVLVPERLDGLGLGYEDFTTTAAEIGRMLYSGPFFGSAVLALGALLPLATSASDPDGDGRRQAEDLVRRIGDGSLVACLAFMDERGRWTPEAPGVTAASATSGASDGSGGSGADEWRLSGRRHLVVDAEHASLVLVTAVLDGQAALFAVDRGDVRLTAVESLDPTRTMATLDVHEAPARLLAKGADARDAVERALRLGRLAIAAESVGGAEEALRLAVDYAQSRRQFGRPIGGFQAIKHKCADMLIAIEAAKAVLAYASWAWDDDSAEAEPATLAAKAAATDAFVQAAADCIQIHGTFGYTREASSQSYYRRARWLSLFLGSSDEDRGALADRLGI